MEKSNQELIFVSNNYNNFEDVQRKLNRTVVFENMDFLDYPYLNSLSMAEKNVKHAYGELGKPLFLFQDALYISCLGNKPGPRIEDFCKLADPYKICRSAKKHNNFDACEKTTLVFHDGEVIHFFEGARDGRIASEPRGNWGYTRWESIFLPGSSGKTYGEMYLHERDSFHSSSKALDEFLKFLDKRIGIS